VTNPERLWVTCASDGVAVEARGYSSESEAQGYRESLRFCENSHVFSPVAEYVLASVADKALDEKHAQMVAMSDRLRGKVSAAEAEAAALRAERDALAVRVGDLETALLHVTERHVKLTDALDEIVDLEGEAGGIAYKASLVDEHGEAAVSEIHCDTCDEYAYAVNGVCVNGCADDKAAQAAKGVG
jgi:hypothetical protein